jgi:hypothetical protein
MKLLARLPLALLLALPAKADILFTNIGQPGAVAYQGNQYGLVDDSIFGVTTVSLAFIPTRSQNAPVGLFFPVFAFSTGADPLGRDDNNGNGFFLLLSNASGELWHSGLLGAPILFHGDGGNDPLLNRAVFHVETSGINLVAGEQYTLTMTPWSNAVDGWFLAPGGDPGLMVTPEPSSFTLLAAGLLWFFRRRTK